MVKDLAFMAVDYVVVFVVVAFIVLYCCYCNLVVEFPAAIVIFCCCYYCFPFYCFVVVIVFASYHTLTHLPERGKRKSPFGVGTSRGILL